MDGSGLMVESGLRVDCMTPMTPIYVTVVLVHSPQPGFNALLRGNVHGLTGSPHLSWSITKASAQH